MKTTLRDIARHAQVHLSTVSCILNGSRGSTRVSEETRQRVLEAARALDYTPNRVAQQLKNRRSQIVGLLVGGLENPFFARMVSLCSEALERKGYDVVLAVRRSDEANDLHLLQALVSRQLDGILLWSETVTEVRERVQRPDMAHTVVMGYPIPGRSCVSANLAVGVDAALDHLQAQGCRRIGYLAPEQAMCREGDPRYDTYCRTMSELGQAPRLFRYDGAAFDIAAARARTERLWLETDRPDALLCFNDIVAIGALMGLRSRNVRVPEEIALVGCDDIPLAAQMEVPLTSIHYPLEEVCRSAVEMLMEQIDASSLSRAVQPTRHMELPATVCIRASSAKSGKGDTATDRTELPQNRVVASV